MANREHPHRIVVQLGVYRSASTWASNAIAGLLASGGPVRIVMDDIGSAIALPQAAETQLVVKVHRPSAVLHALIRDAALPVIVTVRDPLDCVASLMTQFHVPFANACSGVAQSCMATLHLLQLRTPTVLRYEEDARDAATVARLARALDLPADAAACEVIAERLAFDNVRTSIERLIAEGFFGDTPHVGQSHPDTHWHPRHLGAGVSGAHKNVLTPVEIASVIDATRPFRLRFGYAPTAPIDP